MESTFLPPWKQALFGAIGALALMSLGALANRLGIFDEDPLFPWSIASSLMLLFALFNSILSLKADNFNQYWGQSIDSYMGLALVNGLLAWVFSGIYINDAGSYKFIYLVVTIGFIAFLSLVTVLKNSPICRKRGMDTTAPTKKVI